MEEVSTSTTTLNEPASTPSTTQSDSTTLTDEATTVTGLQTPPGISPRAFVVAWYAVSEKRHTILGDNVAITLVFWPTDISWLSAIQWLYSFYTMKYNRCRLPLLAEGRVQLQQKQWIFLDDVWMRWLMVSYRYLELWRSSFKVEHMYR